jgi:hypothetical protein
LIVIAVVLASRRIAGAFSAEAPAWAACLFATCAIAASLVAHGLLRSAGAVGTRLINQAGAGIVTLVPPLALGLVLLPADSAAGLSYLLTLFLFAGVALALWDVGSRVEAAMPVTAGGISAGTFNPLANFGASSANVDRQPSIFHPPSAMLHSASPIPPPHLTANQTWISRTVTPDGRECLEGVVHIPFTAGQKQAVVHLPFCPPFSTLPEVSCDSDDHADVRFKVTAYTYGARVEAKRTAADGEETVPVAVSAAAIHPV